MSLPDSSIAAPPLQVPSEASKRILPWLVAVAFFMESLDTTILNTAVPAISEALHVTPLSMKAVLASYTLSLAVFIPISGWVADRFGTRRVFAAAIGLFTLGSLLCGISSNIHLLVACRILQGMGGSMMVPVGRLTLVRTFAKSELLRAMSFVSIPALVAPMLGPIAGGLIVGVSALAVYLLREYSDRPRRIGSGLSASAGLSRGAHASARCRWTDPVRFGHRPTFVRAGGLRRTHAEFPRDLGPSGTVACVACGLLVSRQDLLRFRCCSSACSGYGPFEPRSGAAFLRVLELAACHFCCRFFIRWDLASPRFSRGC